MNNKNNNNKKDYTAKTLSRLLTEGLESLERGLKVIGEDISFNGVKIPFLGIDAAGRLVILEVSDNDDELVLLKAIDHFDWVFNHMEEVQKRFIDTNIDISLSPKVIMLLPKFSDELLRRIAYFSHLDLQLYMYRIINHTVPEAMKFELVSFAGRRKFTKDLEERTVDDLLDYIKVAAVRIICRKALDEIKNLFPQSTVITKNGYISIQVKNKEIAGIYPRNNFFWVNASKNVWHGIYVNNLSGLDNALDKIKNTMESKYSNENIAAT